MNKQRRERIADLLSKLVDIQSEVLALKDEEQTAFDNLPDAIQESARGADMETVIEHLDDVESDLMDVIETLKTAAA